MSYYRRYRVEGATYFFTLVTDGRAHILCRGEARAILRRVMLESKSRWPFKTDAIVLLPDHLHAMWTLPHADADYSRRWGWIKKEFTKAWLALGNEERQVSRGRLRKRQHGVLQPRFWEHMIRDEDDFERHADYIFFNPVKHGYVDSPCAWPWSSFHEWVKRGIYPENWGVGDPEERFASIRDTVGE